MAAGLSIDKEKLEEFRREINARSGICKEDLEEKILIDMQLPFSCVTEAFVNELHVLEPFGKGNPKPLFAQRQILVRNARILGKNRNVLKMRVSDEGGTEIDALYFGNIEGLLDYIKGKFGTTSLEHMLGKQRAAGTDPVVMAFTYYPDINEYQGIRTPQIIIQNYK